jgi:ABC-type uncharacterized transport system substrate-binding protein
VVGSLARPGGNATGFTAFEYSLAGKWLEILKEVAPAVTRVVLLYNPETCPLRPTLSEFHRDYHTGTRRERQCRIDPQRQRD